MRHSYFYGAVLLCVLTLGYLTVKRVAHELYVVDHFECQFSPLLSQPTQEKIAAYVAGTQELKALPLRRTAQEIAAHFACLKKVSCTQCAAHAVQLACESVMPLVQINDSYVLTDSDAVLEKDSFASVALEQLPAIDLVMTGTGFPVLSGVSKKSIRILNQEIFSHYQVTWIDDTQAWLRDMQTESFSIIFNGQALPDSKMLLQSAQIKKELEDTGLITSRGKKRWVADIRFANQIILSADTGGRCNG